MLAQTRTPIAGDDLLVERIPGWHDLVMEILERVRCLSHAAGEVGRGSGREGDLNRVENMFLMYRMDPLPGLRARPLPRVGEVTRRNCGTHFRMNRKPNLAAGPRKPKLLVHQIQKGLSFEISAKVFAKQVGRVIDSSS